MFELDDIRLDELAYVKVIGVGDGGCISLNRFINMGLSGVEFIAMNTDAQSLMKSLAPRRLQIGEKITSRSADGGHTRIDERSAQESQDDIMAAIGKPNMVFIVAALGDNACSESTSMVASHAKDTGALTVAIVTLPFIGEEPSRKRTAEDSLAKIKESVDAVITINSERFLAGEKDIEDNPDSTFETDKLIAGAIQGIVSLISELGVINLDFADVKMILKNSLTAVVGIGTGTGENASMEAVIEAAALPMFDENIKDAQSIIINITGSDDKLSIFEVNEAVEAILKMTVSNVNIIWGASIDNNLGDTVKVTIIASGFDEEKCNHKNS